MSPGVLPPSDLFPAVWAPLNGQPDASVQVLFGPLPISPTALWKNQRAMSATSSVAEPNASASNDCGLAVDPPRQWTGSVLGRDGGEAVGQTMSQSSAFCGAGGLGWTDV